jgi:hypothetical protein
MAVLLLAAFGVAGSLYAQSDRGAVTGTVKDTSAAVVPDVEVLVTNPATNQTWTATTDTLGIYRVENLPIGTYTVSFRKSGFKTLDRAGVTLLIGQVGEIDASLQVGGTTETVEVSGAAPVLQTQDSTVSTNLDSQAVSELPLNVQGSRNLSNFIFAYVPGAEGSDYSSHIDGGMAMTKEVLIDGTSAVSQLGGYISESQPPMEAVQEFETDTAGIGADSKWWRRLQVRNEVGHKPDSRVAIRLCSLDRSGCDRCDRSPCSDRESGIRRIRSAQAGFNERLGRQLWQRDREEQALLLCLVRALHAVDVEPSLAEPDSAHRCHDGS